MSRYLTPSKIGLLVLVAIYTDSAVPSNGIVPILSFVTSRTVPRSVADCDGHLPPSSPSLSLTISDFEVVLKGLQSTVPGRTLHDKFLERLWAVNSLHSLHEFFRNLKNMVAQTVPTAENAALKDKILLARTSPLGVFVRRAQLEFTRLQFDDTVKLWTNFMRFRQPSEGTWRKRNSMAPLLSFDENFADLEVDPRAELVTAVYPRLGEDNKAGMELSTEEMERLLEFQIEKLQSMSDLLSLQLF
jgi:anaphase-promoting complex subunit 5